MYTSYIGKQFLQLYRARKKLGEDYTARQFFDEVLFPLFFDGEQHLMHVGNSPFFQKPTKAAVEEHGSKSKAQLYNLHTKVAEGVPNMSIYVGYAAENIQATSSGQLTSMSMEIEEEEIYASWIGQGFGVGVSGNLVLLINRPKLLWGLFEGWSVYRKYLQQTPKLKDRQIETWNGHWLNHFLSRRYDALQPTTNFDFKYETKSGNVAIPTIDWVQVIFTLAKEYPKQTLTTYAYNLAKVNTTVGFIHLNLPKVNKLFQLHRVLFDLPAGRAADQLKKVYTTFYTFKNACKLGVIGLKALEPSKLRQFMPIGTAQYASGKELKFSATEVKIKKNESQEDWLARKQKLLDKQAAEINLFKLFKIWIIAMLNNRKEVNKLAEATAQALVDFEQQSQKGRGKTTEVRLSEEVKSAKSLREFLEKLTKLLKEFPSAKETFKEVKDAIIELPTDLFPLFITLIRFEYQYKKIQ